MRRIVAGLLLVFAFAGAAAAIDPEEVLRRADGVFAREGIGGMARIFRDAIDSSTVDGRPDPALLPVYSLYSDALRALRDPAGALKVAESGLALARAQPRPEPEIVADLAASRAFALVKVGSLAQAINALQEAVDLSDAAYGLIPDQVWVRAELADRLRDARRPREAVGVRREIVSMLEKGGDPEWLLKARDALARALYEAEENAEAIAGYRAYLAALEAVRAKDHIDRAHALNDLAVALLREEQNAEAASLLREALGIVGLSKEDKGEFGAAVRSNLAAALARIGAVKEARAAATDSIAIWRTVGGKASLARVRALNLLVEIEAALGHLAAAFAASDEAIALSAGQEADPSGTAIEALDARGMLLHAAQRYREAEAVQRSALAGWMGLRKEDSPKVIVARQNLAGTLVELGDVDEPQSLIDAAIGSADRVLAADSLVRAAVLSVRGRLLGGLGDFAGSSATHAAALAIWQRRASGTAEEARGLSNLAAASINIGGLAEAEDLLRRSLSLWQRAAPGHPDMAFAEGNLIELLQRQGRLLEALALARRFAADAERAGPPLAVASALQTLAALLREDGQAAEAQTKLQQAIELRRAELGDGHPAVAEAEGALCLAVWDTRNLRGALDCAARNLDRTRAVFPPDHRAVGIALNNLAWFEAHAGRMVEGERDYRSALAIVEATYGAAHPVATITSDNLAAHLLDRVGKPAEALGLLRRASANTALAALSQASETIGAEKLLQRSRGIFGREVRALWTVSVSAPGR